MANRLCSFVLCIAPYPAPSAAHPARSAEFSLAPGVVGAGLPGIIPNALPRQGS